MTFKEWSDNAVSEYTCEFGSMGIVGIRDVYTLPCGLKIHDEVVLPRSIFKKQRTATLVDVIVPVSKKKWLKDTYNADLDENRYTEEGYGYPLFVGEDCTERAFEFAEKEYEALCHPIQEVL